MPTPQTRKLDLKKLIKFFDEKPEPPEKNSIGHATALVSLFGEDLAFGLLKEYCSRKNYEFSLLSRKCKNEGSSGSRLDGWVQIKTGKRKTFHFQTEVKNWSAHATDGKRIPLKICPDKYDAIRFERFGREFTENNFPKKVPKVLTVIEKPTKEKELLRCNGIPVDMKVNPLPLLCYWFALYPSEKKGKYRSVDKYFDTDEFFNLELGKGENFKRLYVFSMSSFTRNLIRDGVNEIYVDMENLNPRMDWISEIFP